MDKQYKLIIFDMDGTLSDRETGELLKGVADYFFEHRHRKSPQFAIATNQGGVGLRYWMETGGFGKPEQYPTEDDVWKHIGKVLSNINERIPPVNKGIQFTELLIAFAYQSKKGEWSPTPEHAKNWQGSLHKQFWRQDWRKPAPGMLIEAMSIADVKPEETLMVGDSPEDEQAAANAGCDFQWAWDFFGRDKPE